MQEWEWSGKYPEQPEILRYLNHVADRFDLRRSIAVQHQRDVGPLRRGGATAGKSRPTRARGRRAVPHHRHRLPLGRPGAKHPGPRLFKGESYHTGAWPHEGVDFTGKRVGVIGTGSSGVQSIPVIAEQAAHLFVFQRTPQYTDPGPPRHRRQGVPRQRQDELRRDLRGGPQLGWRAPYTPIDRSALSVSDEERNAIYEEAWQQGGFKFVLALVQRHRRSTPRPTRPHRSSSARRSERSSRTRRSPRSWCPTTTRSPRSGR